MFAKLFIIALRNMRRQLRRAIFTALSFAVAVFIYTVLIAVPVSMDRIADGASKGLRLIVTERNNLEREGKSIKMKLDLLVEARITGGRPDCRKTLMPRAPALRGHGRAG